MKNVKKLLIFAAISTFVFASSTRTDALGGAAGDWTSGYWADDYANIGNFPASVNDHSVAYTDGGNFTSIFNSGGTTWGFTGGTGDDLANIMWGNGSMGASVEIAMTPDNDATDDDESETTFNGAFGMPLAGMDFGVTYASGGTIGVNLRRAQDVWLWNNMLVHFSMTPEDTEDAVEADMQLDVACYNNTTYDSGTSSLFALAFNYGKTGDADAAMGITWSFGVESAMTDWATLRVGYSHGYDFSSGGTDVAYSASEGEDTTTLDDDVEEVAQMGGLTLGLGFNYGSFTLDMALSSGTMFNDPVKYVTGRNSEALGAGWTISYNW